MAVPDPAVAHCNLLATPRDALVDFLNQDRHDQHTEQEYRKDDGYKQRVSHGRLRAPRTQEVYQASGIYQSENLEPSRATPSAPLLMSYTPGCAVGLLGSGSDITVCQVLSDFVIGSLGTARM
jgi:hypothetical protein